MNVTGAGGPIHPGTLLVENKNVTFTNSTDEPLTITPAVNVTVSVVNEGTDLPCIDLTSQVILNLTTSNTTTNIPEANYTGFLLYDETFVGMPGVYHCNVLFIAANVTTASDTTLIGNQTVWIDAIGSKGYWKNHPNATEQHLPITLGNASHSIEIDNNETATTLFKAHKGKFDLDKLAAQLLAAKLNIWAIMNDTKTGCIDGNVTAADDLLAEREYLGPGDDQGKLKKNAKSVALGYHKALDDFNNNGCTLS